MVINGVFIYHFVDPAPRVDIFQKQGVTKKGGTDFALLVGKTSRRAYLLFYCFFGGKKQLLEVLLTSTFIPWILNSFDLSSYSSE